MSHRSLSMTVGFSLSLPEQMIVFKYICFSWYLNTSFIFIFLYILHMKLLRRNNNFPFRRLWSAFSSKINSTSSKDCMNDGEFSHLDGGLAEWTDGTMKYGVVLFLLGTSSVLVIKKIIIYGCQKYFC